MFVLDFILSSYIYIFFLILPASKMYTRANILTQHSLVKHIHLRSLNFMQIHHYRKETPKILQNTDKNFSTIHNIKDRGLKRCIETSEECYTTKSEYAVQPTPDMLCNKIRICCTTKYRYDMLNDQIRIFCSTKSGYAVQRNRDMLQNEIRLCYTTKYGYAVHRNSVRLYNEIRIFCTTKSRYAA